MLRFDEKTKQWSGHEYLIDTTNCVWSISYDERELSIVKNTPGIVVLEAGAMVRFLKIPIAQWLYHNRGIKTGEVISDTDIIRFDYV